MKTSMIVKIRIEFNEPISNTQTGLENLRTALRKQLEDVGISPVDESAYTEWISLEYGDQSVIISG